MREGAPRRNDEVRVERKARCVYGESVRFFHECFRRTQSHTHTVRIAGPHVRGARCTLSRVRGSLRGGVGFARPDLAFLAGAYQQGA